MDIRVETVTPLWTGDALGHADRAIQSAGLLGSLRWWYEVLVRGVGGRACSAVGDPPYRKLAGHSPDNPHGKCRLDGDLPLSLPTEPIARREPLYRAGLCDVCQIFGATGWQRRFYIQTDDAQMHPTSGWKKAILADSPRLAWRYGVPDTKPPSWYFPSEARTGEFTLRLQSRFGPVYVPILAGVLGFIAAYGALGARTQVGCGVIALPDMVDCRPLYQHLCQLAGTVTPDPKYPHLGNMFFASIRVPTVNRRQTFNLRYDLRQLPILRADKTLRHTVMGMAKNDRRIGSKIKISAPYGDPPTIRLWGWLPDLSERQQVLDAVYAHLYSIDPDLTWRELDSPYDKARHTMPLDFLADLMGITP